MQRSVRAWLNYIHMFKSIKELNHDRRLIKRHDLIFHGKSFKVNVYIRADDTYLIEAVDTKKERVYSTLGEAGIDHDLIPSLLRFRHNKLILEDVPKARTGLLLSKKKVI